MGACLAGWAGDCPDGPAAPPPPSPEVAGTSWRFSLSSWSVLSLYCAFTARPPLHGPLSASSSLLRGGTHTRPSVERPSRSSCGALGRCHAWAQKGRLQDSCPAPRLCHKLTEGLWKRGVCVCEGSPCAWGSREVYTTRPLGILQAFSYFLLTPIPSLPAALPKITAARAVPPKRGLSLMGLEFVISLGDLGSTVGSPGLFSSLGGATLL